MRRLAVAALAVLLAAGEARAGAPCTPAAPAAVAEAERQARDADARADEAESVAVRSGNPGAQARADQARAAARRAHRQVDVLRCAAAPEPPPANPLLGG